MTPQPPLSAAGLPYRQGVGIMLINARGQVFVARRLDSPEAWQMPQGGIDAGEDPETAAWREMEEEIGTRNALLLGETAGWLGYDLPEELRGRLWGGRFQGQRQKWFAFRFTGQDADINLATAHPEFDAWRWVDVDTLVALIVPFKRPVYEQVVAELAGFAVPQPA
ncbi:RNA pyrophosphohydrolase [Rhodospirillum rubrum]|uniref:RNA pyrophosphohydrolase n=1 Tax=Rhodospirillum rubrum (strain ATCC 11170 / ATH 1.1.1 / DSM 467 / LMG 4362 / NCIMB 8255 / S1) TaxID=269796 RepID=RPPH_RHORT|nr:RNA pyrophosphohydrolase [Rhodospirillum rubrum]Q2RV14.1 RecName: Full=RNA pyrophosphohydrolase; AltName: Full=(Di)nucleoside polyphosphate hydrolase [Rhodospirillum rubrum ATCC 11170]ABC22031.1 NUDIX hydrolase [Rhodospirillum rubrum ATCC 11170]AEO47743.1 NUDIX hydrolase [Rhodospirillum rubrum F11]MBK5953614.1 RNA pyrophosphohydrolase [Rhodospirillum rubrum]QXG81686.1 RNA pyrophosphohydrolase [Rhodospirillum rubrum]HCF16542.1 RNA pyrophosphohydrolase [Rhodospirillum rubrum]